MTAPAHHGGRRRLGLVPAVLLASALLGGGGLAVSVVLIRSQTEIMHLAESATADALPMVQDQTRATLNLERLKMMGEVVRMSGDPVEYRRARLAAQMMSHQAAFDTQPEIKAGVASVAAQIAAMEQARQRGAGWDAEAARRLAEFTDLVVKVGNRHAVEIQGGRRGHVALLSALLMAKARVDGAGSGPAQAMAIAVARAAAAAEPDDLQEVVASQLDRLSEVEHLRAAARAARGEVEATWNGARQQLGDLVQRASADAAQAAAGQVTRIAERARDTMRVTAFMIGAAVAVMVLLALFARLVVVVPLLRAARGLADAEAGRPVIERRESLRELDGIARAVAAFATTLQEVRQRTIELAAASRAKSEFLAMMSHEVRTPMNGVLGMARLLLDRPLGPHEREYAQTILNSAEALLTILNDILDFTKLEAGKLHIEAMPLEPRRLVDGVVELMRARAEEKGLTLIAEYAPDLPPAVVADPTRLRQILLNLVGNALKFTEAGGVAIAVTAVDGATGGASLRFAVRDSGIGIAPEDRDKLFLRFSQVDTSIARRFGGTGLGLAISKSLVELMGGGIGVDSELGRGSVFWFELPVLPARLEQVPTGGRSEAASESRPLDILLAEDNPVNQKVAVGILSRHQHRITVAHNGAEAVEAMAAGRFDVVLMDMQMPEMDGLEATRRIRALPGPRGLVPIVAMTANALKGDDQRCLAAGMDDYVAKPIDPAVLFDVLARISGQQPIPAPIIDAGQFDAMLEAVGHDTMAALLEDFRAAAHRLAAAMTEAAPAAELQAMAGNFGFIALAEAAAAGDAGGVAEALARVEAGLAGSLRRRTCFETAGGKPPASSA